MGEYKANERNGERQKRRREEEWGNREIIRGNSRRIESQLEEQRDTEEVMKVNSGG